MQDAQTLLYDRYSILHIERTNSFNKVFFALDTYQNPPRNCVIKVFRPITEKLEIIQWIDRKFPQEANRLKQLSLLNSHLPQIYTYSNDSRNYYIVRELIEGSTLKEEIGVNGRLSAKQVRKILIELLDVLEYLHARKVIHQNIKPKNIILRKDDRLPMLINFGSIKRIVATYGFYGNKQIFSSSNIHGYAPPELALGRSTPSTDLYSLGLTAIFMLTGKNPVDFRPNSDLADFRIPAAIASLDSGLAKIIGRAIKSDSKDRYSSAREMLDDLLQKKSDRIYDRSAKEVFEPATPNRSKDARQNAVKDRESNHWAIIMYLIGSLYILNTAIVVWYDWSLSRNTIVPELPEPSTYVSTVEPELAKNTIDKPSMLKDRPKDLIEIPILATGTPKEELRKVLGEPNAIQKGYWSDSSAWIYKNQANGLVDLGYLFDINTDKLQQTEIAIAPSVGLATIEDILSSLLEGKNSSSVDRALEAIYRGQADRYSFELGDLEGSIEREEDDHIYLGVWQAGFH